ncbi:MAG: ABC transporter substrate-binding protein [Centipeda sp. (in: firmicutes)]
MAARLALGASLIVGGCGGSNTAERPKDEIVYVNFRDTRDLNPHLFAGEMYAQKLLYDTLITINPDGTYAPSLATSWEISPDGLTYTFKIREGVKFTDGEVCDAQAILANFNALNGFKERYKWTFLQVLDHFEVPDNQTRLLALEKGEIDLIFGKNMIDGDAVKKFSNMKGYKTALSSPASTRELVLNTTNPILNDLNVRRALNYATNRQAISENIFYGFEPPAETLFAKNVPYANIDVMEYKYNADTAGQLLEQAGWTMGADGVREKNGQKLSLNLLYNVDSVMEKTISEYLQAEYAKFGVQLNIAGQEEQSYRDNMKAGNFDIIFNIVWGMPYDPMSSLAGMTEPVYDDYAAQQGIPTKAEIDRNILMANKDTTDAARQEHYSYVLKQFAEQAAYIPITYEVNKAIYREGLEGVQFTSSQYEVPFWLMSWK